MLVIEAVLFDLDGTLFDRDATVAGIVAWQVREFSSAIAPERGAEFCSRVTTLDAHGHRDKREVYATVATEFGFDSPLVEQLISSFWTEYPHHCHLGSGVAATLTELKRRGKQLGIITNGAASVQNAAIDALGIRGAVDVILISETEGIRKPSPDIFHRAAARMGVAPTTCCFVGDHPTIDVAGAEAAGLRAIWKRTSYWAPAAPVTTIDSIPEILALLEGAA
jgi:putative hydrolase of the HAD superfamily